MSRFVRPEAVRVPLKSNGDWIEIKRRLNTGEYRARLARMSLAVDGELQVNRLQLGMATVTAYLLDWSLTDDAGKPVGIRGLDADALASVLDSLNPEDFGEILEAIEQHESKMDAERVAEKNGHDGANTSPAISPSPSNAAGATSGWPNSIETSTTS